MTFAWSWLKLTFGLGWLNSTFGLTRLKQNSIEPSTRPTQHNILVGLTRLNLRPRLTLNSGNSSRCLTRVYLSWPSTSISLFGACLTHLNLWLKLTSLDLWLRLNCFYLQLKHAFVELRPMLALINHRFGL